MVIEPGVATFDCKGTPSLGGFDLPMICTSLSSPYSVFCTALSSLDGPPFSFKRGENSASLIVGEVYSNLMLDINFGSLEPLGYVAL